MNVARHVVNPSWWSSKSELPQQIVLVTIYVIQLWWDNLNIGWKVQDKGWLSEDKYWLSEKYEVTQSFENSTIAKNKNFRKKEINKERLVRITKTKNHQNTHDFLILISCLKLRCLSLDLISWKGSSEDQWIEPNIRKSDLRFENR